MIAGLVLLVLALLCFVLAVHPFVGYPLSLTSLVRRFGERGAVTPVDGVLPRSMAICVCAYNEEAVIERKVENMLALRERALAQGMAFVDVLVYVDAAADRTAALLEPYRDRIELVVSPERRGKTHGMNLLVARTAAEIVLFTDANVMIDLAAIDAIRRHFVDPRVGCVCGHLVYTNAEDGVTAEVGSRYWRLEEAIKRQESAIGAVMGADGSLFAIRRHLHRPVPERLIDDMYLSLSILLDGYRVVSASDALAYEASVTSSGEEFRRKVRIACQAFNVHRLLWPQIARLDPVLVYMYVSHKLLRWIAGYTLAFSVLFGIAGLALLGVPALPLVGLAAAGLAGCWLGMRAGIGPLASIWEILSAFAGAAIGVWRSLRGQQFQTWTPAASIRSLAEAGPTRKPADTQ